MRNNFKRETKILDMVYYDVCGPINIKSLGRVSYFVAFINDASKKVRDFPIKGNDQFLDIFQKFPMVVERETKKVLICSRNDNGGEYCSKEF
jgi:hypothetical protein